MLALRERTQAALDDVTTAAKASYAECFLEQPTPTHFKSTSLQYARSETPEAKEQNWEWLPKSFDELAAHFDQEFGRLEDDLARMAKELRQAQERGEQLRHRLLDNRSS